MASGPAADAVAARAGGIDIALNAVGIPHVQGTPFAELSFGDYAHPIAAYTRTNFLTAKAAARHMTTRGSGVILTLSTPGSRMAGQVPTLAEVAEFAAFAASDRAGAMTGAIVNLTCGSLVD